MQTQERSSNLTCRAIESGRNTAQLIACAQMHERYKSAPEQFWNEEESSIIRGLTERFDICAHPENEIVVPVHMNGLTDIPTLLKAFSMLNLEGVGPTQLTFGMHNNHGKFGAERDFSWDIVEWLQHNDVPLNIRELSDPLLTGPYISSQFLLAINTAEDICASLDVDSIPPPDWFKNLSKPLNDDEVVISTGQRVLVDGPAYLNAAYKAYYTLTTGKYIASTEPNILRGGKFLGGQAAYRGPVIRKEVDKILGIPLADLMIAEMIQEQYGNESVRFANAPVINIPTKFRNVTSADDLLQRILRFSQTLLPENLARKIKPKVTQDEKMLDEIRIIYHYCPWARNIIDSYQAAKNEGNKYTTEDLAEAFAYTAVNQGFTDNRHVRNYLDKDGSIHPYEDFTNEILSYALKEIGICCLGRTLRDYVAGNSSAASTASTQP